MSSISRAAGSMVSTIITGDAKAVHKKEISKLAKKVSAIQNKVKEFKTKSKMDPEKPGSFISSLGLKSEKKAITLEIKECLKEVRTLKEKMKNTSYSHAKFKHKTLDKNQKTLTKEMGKISASVNKHNEHETYNRIMAKHKAATESKAPRPVREKGEYNGGMVK